MARPPCCRRVTGRPAASLFAPLGNRACHAELLVMSLDEFEAIRLADGEGLKQEDAAHEMEVSRPTFGRVLESAHRKVADALVHGRPLRIEGGPVCTVAPSRPRGCPRRQPREARTAGLPCTEKAAPCGRALPGRGTGTETRRGTARGAPRK
ncbi:MAG: DUF134 domain-containing protein [Candidatus Bipolaricaulis sp.]|nr:DUF134 domain-containing protein [Candidatus Bipolaricaulis sp.]